MAKRLADELVGQLAADGRVCARIVIVVETEHGERSERAWYRDHGLSATAIVERARWQLEGWASRPGGLSGGVALVRLVPDEVRSDDGVQDRLVGRALAGRRRCCPRCGAAHRPGGRAGGHGAGVGGRALAGRALSAGAGGRRSISTITSRPARPRRRAVAGFDARRRHRRSCSTMPVAVELLGRRRSAVAVSGRGEVSAAPAELVRRQAPSADRRLGRPVAGRATLVGCRAVAPVGPSADRHRSWCRPPDRRRAATLVDPRHLRRTP